MVASHEHGNRYRLGHPIIAFIESAKVVTVPAGAIVAMASPATSSWRIGELAKVWGIGRETIRKIFAVEPGVVRVRLGRRRTHTTYSIPASVAERVHNRLTANRD
jgi:hypothetical protein